MDTVIDRYIADVKRDIIEQVGDDIKTMSDDTFNEQWRDIITGNADGSHFFNRIEAREFFEQNDGAGVLHHMRLAGDVADITITEAFLSDDYETLDVLAREYVVEAAFKEAKKEA